MPSYSPVDSRSQTQDHEDSKPRSASGQKFPAQKPRGEQTSKHSNRPSLRDRIHYHFDIYMARGTPALVLGLFGLSALVVFTGAVTLFVMGIGPGDSANRGFYESVWEALVRTLDAGTMGADQGWRYRFVMFMVTLGGLFVISSLIGVLATGLQAKLIDLQKGRSRVVESNHTVILGWSPQIFTIVSELVCANASRRKSRIVILGQRDKTEMEDELRERIRSTGRTRIVCRSGSPLDLHALDIVSLSTARSVIIPSPPMGDPDPEVIKTVLAVRKKSNSSHIVAEIRDLKNFEAAGLAGGEQAEIVVAGDLIARIIAQTCRQSGLSLVCMNLLDFGGSEINFHHEPLLAGKTFGQSLLMYENSSVLGLLHEGQEVMLKPPMNTIIGSTDHIIVVAEDDQNVILSTLTSPPVDESAISIGHRAAILPDQVLILGWNWRAPEIIYRLDQYVPRGSEVTVVSNMEGVSDAINQLQPEMKNQTVLFRHGNITNRRLLEAIDIKKFQHIVILSYFDLYEPQAADSHSLITLLHLRKIADQCGHTCGIVTEIMDIHNRELAETGRADDFIVSGRIISLMMSQISENEHRSAVFANLLSVEGSEIYLRPAGDYVRLGVPVNFYTVVEAARRREEAAFGYRIASESQYQSAGYGVHLNPRKSESIVFNAQDRIILVAED